MERGGKHTLNRLTTSKRTGKSHYTHKRLRTAMNSIVYYLPYLFTYQERLRGDAQHEQQD